MLVPMQTRTIVEGTKSPYSCKLSVKLGQDMPRISSRKAYNVACARIWRGHNMRYSSHCTNKCQRVRVNIYVERQFGQPISAPSDGDENPWSNTPRMNNGEPKCSIQRQRNVWPYFSAVLLTWHSSGSRHHIYIEQELGTVDLSLNKAIDAADTRMRGWLQRITPDSSCIFYFRVVEWQPRAKHAQTGEYDITWLSTTMPAQ